MKYLLTTIALLCAACGDDGANGSPPMDASTESEPTPDGGDTILEASVEAVVENFFEATPSVAGAGVVIVHREHGVLHQKAYGIFEEDRQTILASTSRTITATVLSGLADDGLLDLDAPVESYLNWGDHKPGVTVAQMLSNSSGMQGEFESPPPLSYVCQSDHAFGTLEDCARRIFQATDDSAVSVEPDTEFRYGGAQWQLAGGIAEKVSGKPWAQLVDERFAPCSMEGLGYTNASVLGPLIGLNYPSQFDGSADNAGSTDNPRVGIGAYMTIGDGGKLLLMHLRDGQCDNGAVMSPESTQRMQADRIMEAYEGTTSIPIAVPGELPEGYGLGFWIDRQNGERSDTGVYGAQFLIDPVKGYGVYIALEAGLVEGQTLWNALKPHIEDALAEL